MYEYSFTHWTHWSIGGTSCGCSTLQATPRLPFTLLFFFLLFKLDLAFSIQYFFIVFESPSELMLLLLRLYYTVYGLHEIREEELDPVLNLIVHLLIVIAFENFLKLIELFLTQPSFPLS